MAIARLHKEEPPWLEGLAVADAAYRCHAFIRWVRYYKLHPEVFSWSAAAETMPVFRRGRKGPDRGSFTEHIEALGDAYVNRHAPRRPPTSPAMELYERVIAEHMADSQSEVSSGGSEFQLVSLADTTNLQCFRLGKECGLLSLSSNPYRERGIERIDDLCTALRIRLPPRVAKKRVPALTKKNAVGIYLPTELAHAVWTEILARIELVTAEEASLLVRLGYSLSRCMEVLFDVLGRDDSFLPSGELKHELAGELEATMEFELRHGLVFMFDKVCAFLYPRTYRFFPHASIHLRPQGSLPSTPSSASEEQHLTRHAVADLHWLFVSLVETDLQPLNVNDTPAARELYYRRRGRPPGKAKAT